MVLHVGVIDSKIDYRLNKSYILDTYSVPRLPRTGNNIQFNTGKQQIIVLIPRPGKLEIIYREKTYVV